MAGAAEPSLSAPVSSRRRGQRRRSLAETAAARRTDGADLRRPARDLGRAGRRAPRRRGPAELGLTAGDRVALMLGNKPDFPLAYLRHAACRAGRRPGQHHATPPRARARARPTAARPPSSATAARRPSRHGAGGASTAGRVVVAGDRAGGGGHGGATRCGTLGGGRPRSARPRGRRGPRGRRLHLRHQRPPARRDADATGRCWPTSSRPRPSAADRRGRRRRAAGAAAVPHLRPQRRARAGRLRRGDRGAGRAVRAGRDARACCSEHGVTVVVGAPPMYVAWSMLPGRRARPSPRSGWRSAAPRRCPPRARPAMLEAPATTSSRGTA